MNKIAILTFLLTISSYAQENRVSNKNYITADLTKLAGSFPRLNFGYNRELSNNIHVGFNYGFSKSSKDGKGTDYKFNEYIFELKYILNPEKRTQQFLSFETQYILHKENLVNGIIKVYDDNNEYSEYSYSKLDYKRTKLAFNINYGLIIPFNKKNNVGIIPKIGIGFRVRDINFSNTENLELYNPEQYPGSMLYLPSLNLGNKEIYEKEGKIQGVNMDFAVKLYFKF